MSHSIVMVQVDSRDGSKVIDFEITVDGGKTLTTGIIPVAIGFTNAVRLIQTCYSETSMYFEPC